MKIKYLYSTLAVLCIVNMAVSQTMQIKFCGKTSNVEPTKDNQGNDQRHKGGLRMDLIRIGKLTQSRTQPFYSLGISPLSFANGNWVDGCSNNNNATYCSGCTTCKLILSTTNAPVGVSEGKMVGNVRMRTNNNDLFIESTGTQNVVCFVTNPIDVSAQGGKTIEANVIYEGTVQDGFTTTNVNFHYKYDNGAWVQLLNQNSNFLRIIDTAILITMRVPSAIENLDDVLSFNIAPNPVIENLSVELNSQKTFQAYANISDMDGKLISEQELQVQQGLNYLNYDTRNLSPGIYLFQIGDYQGKLSTRKFVKQ